MTNTRTLPLIAASLIALAAATACSADDDTTSTPQAAPSTASTAVSSTDSTTPTDTTTTTTSRPATTTADSDDATSGDTGTQFLADLRDHGVNVVDNAEMIELGKAICTSIEDEGKTRDGMAAELAPSFGAAESEAIVSASVNAYCPDVN